MQDGFGAVQVIQYVQTHKVAYCIVHKVDRLARNRADDVAIHLALRDAGVMLVSATENIDETPSGMLLHGIMSTIAEFYSRNLATEVVKGMSQKAVSGGTIGKAPVGYLNALSRDELGREVRSVVIDEQRSPHVRWAFQAYASGDWTVSQITDELADRGLTTPPTPRRPAKPLVASTVHRMLTNPYYKGEVVYKGVTYPGKHEPLVAPEVWYQVQSVLTAHQSAADAHSVHDHYLKGTVYCGQCGSRMMITHAKNRHGRSTPTSSAPAATPSAPTAPAGPCSSRTSSARSRTTTPTSASPRPSAKRSPGCSATSSTGSWQARPTN